MRDPSNSVTLMLIVVFIVMIFGAFVCGYTQTIEPARKTQIATALRSHGYRGDTTAALRQVAKDHGWQTKSVPDARVLIWLGLGPRYPHLLNQGTAWISTPQTVLIAKQ
jgi:hypothetical protein